LLANAGAPGTQIKTTSAIYSDAGLIFTTITGNAEAVNDSAYATVKAIQDVASGNVSKELIQKAKAAAKFAELEFGHDITAGIELTGAGLVTGTGPYQIDEVAKKIDAVTEEQVKAVSLSSNILTITQVLICNLRPPSRYSRPRHPSPQWVISSLYLMLTNSASKCKYE